MTKRYGFTLAEVLITLGIIGVVAAMTIPTLMNNTGDQEFKTGFKKVIAALNQAVTMNFALDRVDFSLTNNTGTTDTVDSVYSIFNRRMRVARSTNAAVTENGFSTPATNYTMFFQDGMAISWPSTCGATALTTGAPCKAMVDVNGTKKPNRGSTCTANTSVPTGCTTGSLVLGDQFAVQFYDQQVVPNAPASREVLFGK